MWTSRLVLIRNGALIFLAHPLLFEHAGLEINPHGRKLLQHVLSEKPINPGSYALAGVGQVHDQDPPVEPVATAESQVRFAHDGTAFGARACASGLQGSELDAAHAGGTRAEDGVICANVEE